MLNEKANLGNGNSACFLSGMGSGLRDSSWNREEMKLSSRDFLDIKVSDPSYLITAQHPLINNFQRGSSNFKALNTPSEINAKLRVSKATLKEKSAEIP